MKRTFLMAAMVAAVVCAGTDASAQKKAKKSQLVLDGTAVNVNGKDFPCRGKTEGQEHAGH